MIRYLDPSHNSQTTIERNNVVQGFISHPFSSERKSESCFNVIHLCPAWVELRFNALLRNFLKCLWRKWMGKSMHSLLVSYWCLCSHPQIVSVPSSRWHQYCFCRPVRHPPAPPRYWWMTLLIKRCRTAVQRHEFCRYKCRSGTCAAANQIEER